MMKVESNLLLTTQDESRAFQVCEHVLMPSVSLSPSDFFSSKIKISSV
jgi:hypothetical protein